MEEFLVYVGSFVAAGVVLMAALYQISRSIAAENAIELEEWENL